ncbi:MAG: hypothetical protein IKG69_02350 [Atopobiaceae bacterium]|nr:hypothetical protein [Atopobiaceae bacterium]
MAWNEDEVQQVVGLLTTFNGADEVCAVLGCRKSQLDRLSRAAFGMRFELARKKFSGQGRAMVRKALFDQAMDGSAKALEMLAREQLGMGPVETRKRVTAKAEGEREASDAGNDVLSLVRSKREDRRAKATN